MRRMDSIHFMPKGQFRTHTRPLTRRCAGQLLSDPHSQSSPSQTETWAPQATGYFHHHLHETAKQHVSHYNHIMFLPPLSEEYRTKLVTTLNDLTRPQTFWVGGLPHACQMTSKHSFDTPNGWQVHNTCNINLQDSTSTDNFVSDRKKMKSITYEVAGQLCSDVRDLLANVGGRLCLDAGQ